MSRISVADLTWFIVRLQNLLSFLGQYSDVTLSQSPIHRAYHTLNPKHGKFAFSVCLWTSIDVDNGVNRL